MNSQKVLASVLTVLGGLGAWLVSASPAAAKTSSVLMVCEELNRAHALTLADPDYHRLAAAVQDGFGEKVRGARTRPRSLRTITNPVDITWLAGGVAWRHDMIVFSPTDGVWVHTRMHLSEDPVDRAGRWHRPGDTQALSAVLVGAKLIPPPSTPVKAQSPSPSRSREATQAPAGAAPKLAATAPMGAVAAVVLAGVGGLAAGFGLSALLVHRRDRGRGRLDAPRPTTPKS